MFTKVSSWAALALAISWTAAYGAPSFSDYDQNGDGIMTVDEYDSYTLAPFDRIDTDNDSKISPAEAIVVARVRAQGTGKKPRRMVMRLFERFDTNEDRFLTILELGYGGVGEFFNLNDTNFDGEISLAEWESVVLADAQVGNIPEPVTNDEAAPETPSEPSTRIIVKVPTEPSEPDNSNLDKVLPGDIIATPTPLTGSWLFEPNP